MDWIKLLEKLLIGKKLYDNAMQVKKMRDFADANSKKDPKSLKWDDLKVFKNATMTAATKGLRDLVSKAQSMEKAKLEYPSSKEIEKLLVQLENVMKKSGKASKGAKSPEEKKLREAAVKAIAKHEKALVVLLGKLGKFTPVLDKNLKVTKMMEEYGNVLARAFLFFAKVPSISGTAQNAAFLGLSQDATQYLGEANSLGRSFLRLKKLNKDHIKAVKNAIKDDLNNIKELKK